MLPLTKEDSTPLVNGMDRSSNDLEWAIGLNRRMLRATGLWPPDSRNARKHLLTKLRFVYNVITLLFVLTIPALASLIRVRGDMMLVVDNLQYTLPLLITVLKIFIIWRKKDDLIPLIDMIVNDWAKTKVDEERNVMLKQAKITRTFAMCGVMMILLTMLITTVLNSICAYFGITTRHVTNFTDPGRPMLIQTYYLHDVTKSPQFELTILAQGITLTTSGLCYTAIDNLLGLLVLHICGQMENLHVRLANLGKVLNVKTALKSNINDHIRLIRSVKIIDNTFNLMLLGLVFFFGILFCLQSFLMINIVNQRGSTLSLIQCGWFVAAILTVLLHMGLYCVVGEFLVTQCENVHHSVYKHAWYTMEPKVARDLTLIMLRANKPLHVTAGKTFPMTLATFCNILKTSASYVSVLLANRK